MPQVPYAPYGQEKPSGQATPDVRVNTPLEAFGGGVGNALEGLGGALDHVGDKLWQRAIALQNLQNETEAKEADATYMMDVGKLHAEYNSLQGKQAVQAYPKYVKDMQDRRMKISEGLSNDMARKMFDSSSKATMGRTVFNGAGHAATENKKWALGASSARVDLLMKNIFDSPKDEIGFKRMTNGIASEVRSQGELQGMDDDQIDDNVIKHISKAWSARIIGTSRTAPFEAASMLDRNKKWLTPDDFLRADNSVRSQGRAVGATNIAEQVFNDGSETPTKPGQTLKEMEVEAKRKANELSPDDPILADHAVKTLQTKWNQSKYATRQEQIENEQTVAGAIITGAKDIQELRADPKVAAAIDALPKDKQLGIPARINNYNQAKDRITKETEALRLRGMSAGDVEGFLNEDVLSNKNLSKADADKFFQLQQKLKKDQTQDPRVNRALTQIRGAMAAQLEALGIFKRTDKNKDEYDQFTGALQTALDVYQEAHGKPADYKAVIEDIAPKIIRERTEPGFFSIGGYGTTNQVPFYKQTVPETFTQEYNNFRKSNNLPPPTETETYKAYVRMQYRNLYSKEKQSGSTSGPGPQVPVSK